MADPNPAITKWQRLYDALVERQNHSKNRRATLEFIRQAIKPERYVKNPKKFETRRTNLIWRFHFRAWVLMSREM